MSIGTPIESLGRQPTLVAIGNFDGVHLGHRAVLEESAKIARERSLVPVALTFEPHPTVAVGRPSPACLTRLERKVELIERIEPGLRVVVQSFDTALAALTPEQFVREVLVARLCTRVVHVGANFRFGSGRAGDLTTLASLGERYGFEARAAAAVGDARGRYSSTRIRAAITSGDLEAARLVLGRPHALCGLVVEGQRRARELGFPTANLAWVKEALPPHGVYAVAVDALREGSAPRRLGVGVANIGVRPTMDAGFSVEAHVLDCDADLYGAHLRLHLLTRLRAERKFPGVAALRAQIEEDTSQAREMLRGLTPSPDAGSVWF